MHAYELALRPGIARWDDFLILCASAVGWPETTTPLAERREPPREAPRHDPEDPPDPDGEQRGRPRERDPETSGDGERPELPEGPDRGVDEPTRSTPR